MAIYAFVKNKAVLNVFESSLLPSDFPDLQDSLEVVDAKVQVGFLKSDDGTFSAPPPVVSPSVISLYDFLKKLTSEERAAIRDQIANDPVIADQYMLLSAAPTIDTNSKLAVDFVTALKGAGALPISFPVGVIDPGPLPATKPPVS